MTAKTSSTPVTRAILKAVEPPIFHYRAISITILTLITLFLSWHAAQVRPNAGWLKMVPQEHPYMQTFMEYYRDFGGANTVLIAVHNQAGGDIYEPAFMETLRQVSDDAFFIPGVDRARVTSIFSPSILFIEVIEGGLSGENVIPSSYAPTPEMMERIRGNVAKANVIGRLVSEDQRTALVQFELLENDPRQGTVAQQEDEKLPYLQRMRKAWDQGAALGSESTPEHPALVDRIAAVGKTALASAMSNQGGGTSLDYVEVGAKLEEIRAKYESEDVSIHIVGFAKVVDDMTRASVEVAVFFFVALLLMGILLWIYLGSLPLAGLVVVTSLIACIWEMGLLHLVGYGLDPFAMLVPFLIMSVSVSHGVQYVNAWANEVSEKNVSSYNAALATFRSLAIPGVVALVTDMVGFGTIYIINIQIIREMSVNAVFGMLGVIVVNKLMLPIILSYLSLPNPEKFRKAQEVRDHLGSVVFRRMAVLCRRGPATLVLVICAGLAVYGAMQYPKVRIGDTTEGVPELRPDSRFNKDARAIAEHFTMGVDHLKIIGESFDDGCVDYEVMAEMDRFSWYMKNLPEVRDVLSLIELAKLAHSGLSEGRLDAERLPRNRATLAQTTSLVPTTTGFLNDTCAGLAIFIFTRDHKAETIQALTDQVKHYKANLQRDERVNLRLASGNIGVMAATNEEVHANEVTVVIYVYAVIALFLWLSFRTVSGVLCVGLPLSLVTLLGYALMVHLDIGMKVATLPVLALATGIGVDYGIYSYSVIAAGLRNGLSLEDAYYEKMRTTGKATLFTGAGMAIGVALWIFSELQFQRDMGILLVFAFTANMIGAIVVLPALAHFLGKEELKHAGQDLTLGADDALEQGSTVPSNEEQS